MLVIVERRGAAAIASALAVGLGEEGERGKKRREFLRRAILIHLLVKGPWGYRFYAWLGAISRYGLDYT